MLKTSDGRRHLPEMVAVPTGIFTMGSHEDEIGRLPVEAPQHTVRIEESFTVAKFAISVDQFAAFIENAGYQLPLYVRYGTQPRGPCGARAGLRRLHRRHIANLMGGVLARRVGILDRRTRFRGIHRAVGIVVMTAHHRGGGARPIPAMEGGFECEIRF